MSQVLLLQLLNAMDIFCVKGQDNTRPDSVDAITTSTNDNTGQKQIANADDMLQCALQVDSVRNVIENVSKNKSQHNNEKKGNTKNRVLTYAEIVKIGRKKTE